MIIVTLKECINRYGQYIINKLNGEDMEYWFIAYKVRSRNGDTYAGHKIIETSSEITPHIALEKACQDVAESAQADISAIRVVAFNRL
ncbi:hypothetical protein [Proteus myxofaciens]|nr:hypothetical protein [Proteus myxofaciens]